MTEGFNRPGYSEENPNILRKVVKKSINLPENFLIEPLGMVNAGKIVEWKPKLDTSQFPCFYVDIFENPRIGDEGILAYRREQLQLPNIRDYMTGFTPDVYINKANNYDFSYWNVRKEEIIPPHDMEKIKEINSYAIRTLLYNYDTLRGLLKTPLQQTERLHWEIERYKEFMSVTTDFMKKTGIMGDFLELLQRVGKETGLYNLYMREQE